MKIRIALFGALRDLDASGSVELDVPDRCTIALVRERLQAYAQRHAPAIGDGLIRASAFATANEILHDHRAVPDDGQLALLPPVSGG